MKLWNFENTLARNLDTGGSASPTGGEPAAGGGSASAASGGSSGQQGGAQGAAAAAPPASLLDAAQRAAQAAGGQGDGQPPPNGQQPTHQNGSAYLPDGLPETLRGKTDKETIDKLAEVVGKLPKAPATPKDYKFDPPADFKTKFGDLKDDPVIGLYRDVAHKHGLSNEQFQAVVVDLYAGMDKAGMLQQEPDYAAEMQKLMPKGGDPKENARRVHERIGALSTFVSGLEARGAISKAQAADLAVMWSSADAVMAFEKVLALIPKEHGPQGGGVGAGGSYGWPQAEADMADARYSSTSPKYDPAFRKQADERMRQLPPKNTFRRS